MLLHDFKTTLGQVKEINFKLTNGIYVPKHFHITELAQIDKHYIDCGGTIRKEQKISFQLWHSTDLWHRLEPSKLLSIINIAEQKIGVSNHEIEIEYQGETIGKYGLSFDGTDFVISPLQTACLAEDTCGISTSKPRIRLSDLNKNSESSCCTPNSGCC